jgi:DNA-binding CsgD family transcriptional regulator
VLGFLDLSLGDAAGALKTLEDAHDSERHLGWRDPGVLDVAPEFAEALVLAGDLDRGRSVQAELVSRGQALGRPSLTACGLKCRGLIAAADGQAEAALVDLASALKIQEALAQPLDRARTFLALGTVQRRAKRRADARGSLESALAVFEELGAALWSEQARGEIRRLGGRRTRDRDELTETERRIATLAADGRSNREIALELFVSERTVEANLTRAYRKLGVRSRTELARRLPTT